VPDSNALAMRDQPTIHMMQAVSVPIAGDFGHWVGIHMHIRMHKRTWDANKRRGKYKGFEPVCCSIYQRIKLVRAPHLVLTSLLPNLQ